MSKYEKTTTIITEHGIIFSTVHRTRKSEPVFIMEPSMSTQQELIRQQRIATILQQLTPLYMRQTDLYRVWGAMGTKPEELTALQEEISILESEHDSLSKKV